MGQCAIKSPIIALLSYDIGSIDDMQIDITQFDKDNDDQLSVFKMERILTNDTTEEDDDSHNNINNTQPQDDDEEDEENSEERDRLNKMKKQLYERQLSKEINDNIRKTRKEILVTMMLSVYPDLNIPHEILNIILDFEQNDSLNEIFTLFDKIKSNIICNIYIIPYCLGWIEMLIFGYLSSEYWTEISSDNLHMIILGIILLICSIIQIIGCYKSIKLNISSTYLSKLINLKSSFFNNNLHHYYDNLHYMKCEDDSVLDGWELFIPFQKWCGALRIQNIYNVRNIYCKPSYILLFYLTKPIFCFILGIQLISLSPHCLSLWLLFYLYFTILVSINVFNKSPIGSLIGCCILLLIISATSITIYPQTFRESLTISFEIFVFLIFLLYLFSLYLICCSGRVSSSAASGNMLGVWILLFSCYCLWVSELLSTHKQINFVLIFSIYLLYISFQMLLLTSCDLQSIGINCYYQIKFIFIAILFGWLIDLDSLSFYSINNNHGLHADSHINNNDDNNDNDHNPNPLTNVVITNS